jgi:UDP-3-O-[3-hydroxymyristoyl] glucosamine N-acyltransferase
MKITAKDIQNLNSPYITMTGGSPDAEAYRPWPAEHAVRGSLVYVSTIEDLDMAVANEAGIIVCLDKIKNTENVSRNLKSHQALFTTNSISAAMALINPHFDDKKIRWPTGAHHHSGQVSPSATIGKNVTISAGVVIGDEVVIGNDCFIGPNSVIESRAVIGAGTHLHSQVFIGSRCIIGSRCEIHPNTTIGSDGFGYTQGPDGVPIKIPQLGIVVLEDNVEIGSNCAIDRATLTETRICSGTKLDNLCHIGHNCKLGKNGFFAAGFMTAGSTTVGDNFKCGGMVALADHITITDNVTLGGRTTVTKDILESGAYTGYPVQPVKEGLKTLVNITHIGELKKQMATVLKHLGIKGE